MKILLYPNPTVAKTSEIEEKVKTVLREYEITENKDDNFDLIITIGGDGTILKASELAFKKDIPIIAVNSGRLGYLTSLECDEIDKLPDVLENENKVLEHILLDVYIDGVFLKTVVNEAAIIRENYNGIVDIKAEIVDGDEFNYLADGFIVSTPTGSTAYSFSAGGPIIEHTADNILLTPVCPHSLANRSLILSGDRTLRIKAESRSKVILLGDGELLSEIKKGSLIEIKKSEKILKIYKKLSGNFYSVLKTKLL
jgi:NAD+ kinase